MSEYHIDHTVTFRSMRDPSFDTSPIFGDVFEVPTVGFKSYNEAVANVLWTFGFERDEVIICEPVKEFDA